MATLDPQADSLVALAARARNGETDACEDLCLKMYPTIEKWLFGMIRERHYDVKQELVLDVTQEVWMQLQRKMEQFKGETEASWMAWSYRVTFATCSNYLKKYVKTRQREETVEELPEPTQQAAHTPQSELIQREKLNSVREAVAAIKNPQHREAIILFFFEEMSQKEIAEQMGATESAVSTWVYRGKAAVEEILTTEGLMT
jgi:RNA polymerase sigma-70 factor (ECF subfamily)